MKRRNHFIVAVIMVLSLLTSHMPGKDLQVSAGPLERTLPVVQEEKESVNARRLLDLKRQDRDDVESVSVAELLSNITASVEVRDSSLNLNDSTIIKVTLAESPNGFEGGNLVIATEKEGKIYRDTITLTKESARVFTGEFYAFNEKVSGTYDVESIHLFDEAYENFANITTGLPQSIFSVSGTMGGYQPQVDISMDKDVYGPGEYIHVTVEVENDVVDFLDAYLTLQMKEETQEHYLQYVLLEQTAPGVLEGELYVQEYMRAGTYRISSIYLDSKEYALEIYQTPEDEYDMDFIDYTDEFTTEITISGTKADESDPIIIRYDIDKTEIERDESVTITVEAEDHESGITFVYASLESEFGESLFIELFETEDNIYVGSFNPMEEYIGGSEIKVLQVAAMDQAENTMYVKWVPETILQVDGYGHIDEIYGEDRFLTAIEISKLTNASDTVILAVGTDFPDALAAGPLAYALNAPILLTRQNGISESTLKEIQRREATNVILLGGPSAISDSVITSLEKIGIKQIRRISGNDRYLTAVAVGEELLKSQSHLEYETKEVVLVNGNQFADALASGSMASSRGLPILLTNGKTIHKDVERFLDENSIELVHVVGGPVVISDEVVNKLRSKGIEIMRYAGSDRFNTSVDVALKTYPHSDTAFVTNGMQFADALAAAPLAANINAPILLVSADRLPQGVADLLSDGSMPYLETINVVGGNVAVSDAVKTSISRIISTR